MRLPLIAGQGRTPAAADDDHCISDGRWSRDERQIDVVDLTECAGCVARTGAFGSAIIACLDLH
jgi:hypothetical protein